MTRAPSVRRLLGDLLGVVGLLVAGLIVVTSLQINRSNHQADVENRRAESFLLADSMRQSSNDLTNMVRLYVSTGDTRFRDHYDEILAIRSGTAPRPLDDDSSFWDRVLAEGKGFVEYGPPESLVEQMRAADFTDREFDALTASLRASNDLAQLELEVMDRVAIRIEQGVDSSYAADVAPEYERLVDDAYLAEKGVIMRAVGDFIDLVEQRTLADVERAREQSRQLFGVQIAILVAIVVVGARAFVVTRRQVLGPLDDLTVTSRRIADGDYAERAEIEGVTELRRVAGAFNEMAGAVEADVTARQRAERLAVEANQAKSSFLATMSHEIRTPMIGVTGMLEVLAQSDLTPPQRQMVGTAQSSAAALLQIIGDTLDFSKIEAGKLEIVSTTFSLRAVMDAAVATFIHTASAKGLRLTARCDQDVAPAHVGDALRIRQIISNLLSNAVKFTEEGGIELTGRVLHTAADGAQSVEIAVADTGAGLSDEQQQHLFQEFAQAERTTTQRFGGTGLGLVICRRLALLMGGEVTMESELGRGTTMRLLLTLPPGDPAQIVPEATFTATRFAARPAPSRDEAIEERSLLLLAEDHSVNRAVILHQLAAIGFCADSADDGHEAFERFTTGQYAMVLTDLHMPRMTGYELIEAIRRHEAEHGWTRTPVMALTANVTQGEPERCRAAGMDDFAAKPTTIPLLAAALRRWLPHVDLEVEPVESVNSVEPGGPVVRGDGALDPTVLEELTGGDADLAADVLRDYMESTVEDLARLGEALAAGDVDTVRRQAHRIKGASATVGARDVHALAARLETLAEGEPDVALLESLRDDLSAATDALAKSVR